MLGRRVTAAVLCLLLIPGLFGCRKEPGDEPGTPVIDGGTHTHRDPDAPTAIESTDLMNVETRKASEIEGMRPLLDALTEYHESLFR